MKCANCTADALFEYRLTQALSIFYCGKHLPKFLGSRKQAQLLPVTEAFKKATEEVAEILAPAPAAQDEPVTESEVEEEPKVEKPKKKASKKKAE